MTSGEFCYIIRSHLLYFNNLLFDESFKSKNRKLVDHVRSGMRKSRQKAEIETDNK